MEQCVVSNRVLLLGLDALYREAMKRHERTELLACAREVAAALRVKPAEVRVEGYYGEDDALTEYFRLVRALQDVAEARVREVGHLPAFVRLRQIAEAPLFGRPEQNERLLPVGRDSLSQALLDTRPHWTVEGLTAAAAAAARATDDISLVGLAARAEDPVVLTALRESVVLYALTVLFGMPPRRAFVWDVDDDLAHAARRFIELFNALFHEHLPPPTPEQAEAYWEAHDEDKIVGRCVRLGADDRQNPVRHYHWAICRQFGGELMVQEFWREQVWTTAMYHAALELGGGCPNLRRE